MQSIGSKTDSWIKRALGATMLSLITLPATAGIISINYESALVIDGVNTSVQGNFLLDSSVDLQSDFTDGVVVGGGLTAGDFESGPINLDSLFTLFFTTNGIISVTGDDGPAFWGFQLNFDGVTTANFFDFILSDQFSAANLLAGSEFTAFLPGGPNGGQTGPILSLSANLVAVSEPASIALLMVGAAAIAGRRKRA